MRFSRTLLLMGAMGFVAQASVTVTVDLLDPSEGGPQPPAGILVADVMVDVSEDDTWTAAGLRVTVAGPDRTIRYALDPNTNEFAILNPGAEDPFVTCISRPRPRLGNARFENALASWAGRYCPTGAGYTATPTEFNVAWFASPPPNSSSPSVDGAIARVAIEIPTIPGQWCVPYLCCVGGVFPATAVPPNLNVIARFECFDADPGVVSATFDEPAIVGQDWVLAFNPYGFCRWDINLDTDGPDVEDLATLLASFGACSGDPAFDPRANVAGGLCVDVQDLSLFLAHFGEQCCLN